MWKLRIQHSSYFSFAISLILTLSACSQESASNISFIIQPAEQTEFETLSITNAFAGKQASGLLSTGFCYAIHVTGDGITDPRSIDRDESTCDNGPRGLGTVFGPYKYGSEARIKVPSGSNRRFDLIGFKNPFVNDANCSKVLKIEKTTKTEHGELRVHARVFYGGTEIDPDNQTETHPKDLFYVFARSALLTLAPGEQNISLAGREWVQKTYDSSVGSEYVGTKMYPPKYDCPNNHEDDNTYDPYSPPPPPYSASLVGTSPAQGSNISINLSGVFAGTYARFYSGPSCSTISQVGSDYTIGEDGDASFLISSLADGIYILYVKIFNAAGASACGNPVSFEADSTLPLPISSGFTVTGGSDNTPDNLLSDSTATSIDLNWTPAEANVHYRIDVLDPNLGPVCTSISTVIGANSASLTCSAGFTPGITYIVEFTIYDQAGNPSFTTFTFLASAP